MSSEITQKHYKVLGLLEEVDSHSIHVYDFIEEED